MDTEKIIEVLNRSRRINLKEREPLPEGEAYIVGASNEHYDVIHYYYGLEYTNHDPEQNTFGGYVVKEGEEPIRSAFGYSKTWWTMNYGYGKICRDWCWVVESFEDGDILAKFLNSLDKNLDIDATILGLKLEIQRLEEKIRDIMAVKVAW